MKKEILNKILGIYIGFFIIYSAAKRIVPFALFMQGLPNDAVYMFFNVASVIMLIAAFFIDKNELKVYKWPLLLCFVLVTIISSVINAKYGIVANVAVVICSLIHYFLFFSYYGRVGKEKFIKHIKIIMDIVMVFWIIATVVSFVQFYKLTAYRVMLDGVERRIGFFDNRLFGVFIDPNFAAIISLVLIVMAVMNILSKKHVALKIWYILTIGINFSYIVLSGSRAVEISMYIIAMAGAFFGIYYYVIKQSKAIKKTATICFAVIFSVAVIFVGGFITKKMWEELPRFNEEKQKRTEVSLDRTDVNEENISNNRFEIWKSYVNAMEGKYVFGMSPRNCLAYAREKYPDSFMVVRNYSIHNGYLAVFAYTGIAGCICIFSFIAFMVGDVIKYILIKKKADKEYILIVLIVAALAIYSFFFTELFLINNFTSSLIWPLFGYLVYQD